MKPQIARLVIVVLFAFTAFAQLAISQVATGTPRFDSFGGGPFDTVDMGNLNAHFTIPVLHKAGRGLPFSFDLTYDSSVWKPVTVGATTYWSPALNWGWQQKGSVGYITYTVSSSDCQYYVDYLAQWFYAYTQYYYMNWAFVDDSGVSHPLSGMTQSWSGGAQPGTSCDSPSDVPSATGTATDGSGYTLSISSYTHGVVTTIGGNKVDSYTGITIVDSNGNKITSDSSGHYYDTLSSTTPVLTVSGWNFTYTAPSAPATVSTVYKTYTVRTNFGVTSPTINEYGPLAVNLIDYVQLPDGTKYKFTYETTSGTCTPLSGTDPANCVTARIATIKLPTGGQISYTYTGGSHGINRDGSTASLTRALSTAGTWTYARAGSGSSWTTTVTDPASNQTVLNFMKDTATSANTNRFFETQRLGYQGSSSGGTLLGTVKTCYNSICPNTAVASPITNVQVQTYYSDGTLQENHWTSFTNSGLPTATSRGNVGGVNETSSITYASLGGNIFDRPSIVSVSGSDGMHSYATYAYDESAYPVQPTTGTPQQTTATIRGNATTITRRIANSSGTAPSVSQHVQYYDTGTPYKTYDVNGAVTTYTYGTGSCGNSFPIQITQPITTLSTSATWDCTGGIATTSTDVNGKTTTYTYNDPYFWRPASVQDPLSNTTNLTYTPYNQSTQALASVESKLLFNGNNSVVDQLTTVGVYGQALYAQQREGPSSPSYDTKQILYDSFLRAYKTSMPCISTSITFTGQNIGCPSSATTTNTYDALGRVTQTSDGGAGYVNYTYTKNDVLQAIGPVPSPGGENTKQKQMEYDAVGRLVSVCEVTNLAASGACGQTNAKNGYLTQYVYDNVTINSLIYLRTTVRQNSQTNGTLQTRNYLYDLLGRLVQETNPENGITNYTFDSATGCSGTSTGDLIKKVDAKGNTTCYTYDVMHRVTTVTYTGLDSTNTPTKTFVYDTATVNGVTMTNAKGRLAEAYTGPVASKTTDVGFKYSARGEILDIYQSTPHSGGYYHPTATYWANGAVNTLWISQIPAITYGVDGMGRVSTVSATSGQNPVTSTVYDLSQYKTTVNYGSLDSDVFTADANTGRMTQYKFNVGSNSLTGSLTWNQNGSLNQLAIADTVPGTSDIQTCSHTHDDLARIATVNCVNGATTKWIQSFTYDAFGNIKKASSGPGISFQPSYTGDVGTSTSPSNQFYQIGSGLTGASNYQDANGQVIYDGTHNYTWDVEHKMLSVDAAPSDCSTSGQCLIYDALGRMVEKRVAATYTQIVYSPSGKKLAVMSGQTLQKAWVPLPGGGTAIYTLSGLVYYRHSDHLGSSRLTTTPSRTMYTSTAYAPYGEPYAETATKDRSFTGQDEDTTTGMHDFLDRKYNPVQGRWLSPDSIGLAAVDMASPQSWNRYAYVVNNPLALVDPFGDFTYAGCDFNFDWGCFGGDLPIDWCVGICNVGGDGSGGGGGSDSSGSVPLLNFPDPPLPQKPPICNEDIQNSIQKAFMAQLMANLQIGSGATQREAFFGVAIIRPSEYRVGSVGLADPGGNATINNPVPGNPWISFHTHWGSNPLVAWPSTPTNNIMGDSKLGDTLMATKSGTDIYVISKFGLSLAPKNGSAVQMLSKGSNFDDWFKQLKAECNKH